MRHPRQIDSTYPSGRATFTWMRREETHSWIDSSVTYISGAKSTSEVNRLGILNSANKGRVQLGRVDICVSIGRRYAAPLLLFDIAPSHGGSYLRRGPERRIAITEPALKERCETTRVMRAIIVHYAVSRRKASAQQNYAWEHRGTHVNRRSSI